MYDAPSTLPEGVRIFSDVLENDNVFPGRVDKPVNLIIFYLLCHSESRRLFYEK